MSCTWCGNYADVLNVRTVGVGSDNIYSVDQGVIDAWAKMVREAATEATRAELEDLRASVAHIQDTLDGAVAARVLTDAGPRWKKLADFMRPKSGGDVATYLGLLLAILVIFIKP